MEKFVEKYKEIQDLNDKLAELHKKVERTTKRKNEEIECCPHDLVYIFDKEKESNEDINCAQCLVCGKYINFTRYYQLYDKYNGGVQFGSIRPISIIDGTQILSEKSRQHWCLWNQTINLSADRARNKFVEIIEENENTSPLEIKKKIIDDLILYEKEFYGNKNTSIPEYTIEEVRLAMQPDNIEMVNAWGTECVDLSSDDVKRKIK